MKRILLPLVGTAAFWASGVAGARAETPLELLERAQKDLQTHVDAAKKEETAKAEQAAKAEKPEADKAARALAEIEYAARLEMQGNYPLQNAVQLLNQVHNALVADRAGEVARSLQQLSSLDSNLPDDMRKDVDALVQTINKERTDRDAAYAKEVDAACKQAGEVLVKATAPKDLDGTLQELTKLASQAPARDYYNGGNDSWYSSKLQAAVQFVNHWQDYLLARSRDNEEAVTQALRNLSESSSYNQVPLVPRSEILARMPVKEPTNSPARTVARPARSQAQLDADADEIVRGVKTLGDVPGALAKLADLRKEITSQPTYSYRSDSDLGAALTSLEGLERTSLEIRNGLAANLSLGNRNGDYNGHPDLENALLPLRVELVKLAAPRLLGAPDSEKPTADEGLDAYLRRLIEAAKARKDWQAVARGLELKHTLATMTSNAYTGTNDQESEAFKSFFAGNNLLAAGQYEQAVVSYLTALRTGQADLPSADIGERLATIEKAHPAEYASGKEYVLNPPRPAYGDPRFPFPGGPMMSRGGYDPRFPGGGRPGFPGQPPVDEKLAVPAASAAPSPSPSPKLTPAASTTPSPGPTNVP